MPESLSFLGQSGPYSTLRRSAVDPITGNATLGPLGTGDPNEIIWRGGLLPVGRTRDGRTVPAGSQLGKGLADFVSSIPDIIPEGIKTIDTAGRMMRGEVPMHDEDGRPSLQAISTALGAAGLAATGSLPFSAPGGALRMFGGRAAKTADLGALGKAEGLAALGADRKAIWDQTGWFQGADKQWRHEISDDLAFLERPMRAPPGYEMLQHSDVQDAYPAMWGRLQQSVSSGPVVKGLYDEKYNTIVASGPTESSRRSVALHELQHAIQRQEGFARGGNPVEFTAAKGSAMQPSELANWQYAQYRRQAGEVEARNVQARQNMSPDERRATPPWLTQDTSDSDQIVRLGPLGALGQAFYGR